MMSKQLISTRHFLSVLLLVGGIWGSDATGDLTPCSPTKVPPAQEREVYGEGGRVIDVSHRITPEMPKFGVDTGVGVVYTLTESLSDGALANVGELNNLGTHTGTHVDAPGHFCQDYFDAGYTVGSLDLDTLNGPGLVVQVPRESNITDKVMESLNIPKGTKRVLFKTLNTDRPLLEETSSRSATELLTNVIFALVRQLMRKTEFDSSYTGFKTSGAKWLVENTDIKLVGEFPPNGLQPKSKGCTTSIVYL